MYAGLRLLEILSNTDKTIEELLEGINIYYSEEEEKYHSDDNIKFKVVEEIKKYVISKGYFSFFT